MLVPTLTPSLRSCLCSLWHHLHLCHFYPVRCGSLSVVSKLISPVFWSSLGFGSPISPTLPQRAPWLLTLHSQDQNSHPKKVWLCRIPFLLVSVPLVCPHTQAQPGVLRPWDVSYKRLAPWEFPLLSGVSWEAPQPSRGLLLLLSS